MFWLAKRKPCRFFFSRPRPSRSCRSSLSCLRRTGRGRLEISAGGTASGAEGRPAAVVDAYLSDAFQMRCHALTALSFCTDRGGCPRCAAGGAPLALPALLPGLAVDRPRAGVVPVVPTTGYHTLSLNTSLIQVGISCCWRTSWRSASSYRSRPVGRTLLSRRPMLTIGRPFRLMLKGQGSVQRQTLRVAVS